MKNLTQYVYSCTEIIFKFLKKQCTETELISKLREIEKLAKNDYKGIKKDGQSLWFKFGSMDSLATTISDIEQDLKDGNRKFRIETFKTIIEINPHSEIKVFFS